MRQLDTETLAAQDITTALTVLTNTPSATVATRCGLHVELSGLDGSGGTFLCYITLGGVPLQPYPMAVAWGENEPGIVQREFFVLANKEVVVQILSPNAADTSVGIVAYLFDTTPFQPETLGATYNPPTNFSDMVIEPATRWTDIVLSEGGTTMEINSVTGGFTAAMVGKYLYLEHTTGVAAIAIIEYVSTNQVLSYYPDVFYNAIFADPVDPVDLTAVRGVLGGRVLLSEETHRTPDQSAITANAYITARLLGTIAAGTHVAQTGDVYAALPTNFADMSISETTGLVSLAPDQAVNVTKWGGTAVASANVLIDGAITAAKIAASALNGKGDWNTTTPPTTGEIAAAILVDPANKINVDELGITKAGDGNGNVTATGTGVWNLIETVPSAVKLAMEADGSVLDTLDSLVSEGAFTAEALANAPGGGATAEEVWSSESRTLTSSSSTVGPTSGTESADVYTTAFKNGTRRLDARVRNWDGDDILQADISSIAYTAYLLDASNPDTRTAIDGHTAVTLDKADVIFDTLQTDEYSSDYNFSHTPPISTTNLFTIAGRDYLIEYTITPTSGEKIIVRFRVACK